MHTKAALAVLFSLFFCPLLTAQQQQEEETPPVARSFYKLSTSNGLLSAVYDSKKNVVEYVYPHIFALYDSGRYVNPFVGNIRLNIAEPPSGVRYLKNTHVITASYDGFTANYFSSFTSNDKVFYVVLRGPREKIERLSCSALSGDGCTLTGVSMLTTSWDDLSIHTSGTLRTASLLRRYDKDLYEKYLFYGFTDSLHTDTTVVSHAVAQLKRADRSLLDDEVRYMEGVFSACRIPQRLSPAERNVVEQQISFLKMAQVSQNEIFPSSRGQVLAALRPGLWHAAWVRDGSYAIQAMTRLGMYAEARKALEFMLKAPPGRYSHFIHKDGKDYGIGADYQISVCRYFGNGKEESTYGDGPNIEIDNFGLFLCAYADYVASSRDTAFHEKWNPLVRTKVADVTISCIDTNALIKADSGPWEHYLEMPRQYTFTSGVCARGLEGFAAVQKLFGLPADTYLSAASTLKRGILTHMLCDNRYIKGNVNDQLPSAHEYYDAGVYEIFANGLIDDKDLFLSHMDEYDKVLRIKGDKPGYIRLNSNDPYENQEWVFINLRIALADLHFGKKAEAARLLNSVTAQAAANNNIIPEMFSNKLQLEKVTDNFKPNDVWCNCLRKKGEEYIGAIPMVGYGSGAYILTMLASHDADARP